MIERYLENIITEDLKEKMVFISGPRQVGKTTLAVNLAKKIYPGLYEYLNWDNAADREKTVAVLQKDLQILQSQLQHLSKSAQEAAKTKASAQGNEGYLFRQSKELNYAIKDASQQANAIQVQVKASDLINADYKVKYQQASKELEGVKAMLKKCQSALSAQSLFSMPLKRNSVYHSDDIVPEK